MVSFFEFTPLSIAEMFIKSENCSDEFLIALSKSTLISLFPLALEGMILLI